MERSHCGNFAHDAVDVDRGVHTLGNTNHFSCHQVMGTLFASRCPSSEEVAMARRLLHSLTYCKYFLMTIAQTSRAELGAQLHKTFLLPLKNMIRDCHIKLFASNDVPGRFMIDPSGGNGRAGDTGERNLD